MALALVSLVFSVRAAAPARLVRSPLAHPHLRRAAGSVLCSTAVALDLSVAAAREVAVLAVAALEAVVSVVSVALVRSVAVVPLLQSQCHLAPRLLQAAALAPCLAVATLLVSLTHDKCS